MARHDTEAFQFPEHPEPVPALADEVERLWTETRYRSALDVVLRYLRSEGKSAAAFTWAMPLLRTMRNTPDPDVAEPISLQQFGNPYFAPIATECARCMKSWYSSHVLDMRDYRDITVLNPIGQQCPVCRYSLCRNCFDPREVRCPEPGCPGELGQPVLPTGRPRGMPDNPHTEKLEHVLILWRDTPIGREEADEMLDVACTWQDREGITVRAEASQAGERELDLEKRIGLVQVGLYERLGMISEGGLLHRTRCAPIESPGRGRRLVFVTSAPSTGFASRLAGPITYLLPDEPDRDRSWRRWFRRGRSG